MSFFDEDDNDYFDDDRFYDEITGKGSDEYDFLDDDEKELVDAGIDIDEFDLMTDFEKREVLEEKGLDPDDYSDMFDDESIIDLDDDEFELVKAGIDLDEFDLMDDSEKADEMEYYGLDPRDFIGFFDDPEFISRDSYDSNYNDDVVDDDETPVLTEFEYNGEIVRPGHYTDEELLYENTLFGIAESYGLSFKAVCNIAERCDYNIFSILGTISRMTDDEKLATFAPEERIRYLTGADIEVCRNALEKFGGNEEKAIENIKNTFFKKHITALMMSEVAEATDVAFLETRRFLECTNGDVKAAIELIEALPLEFRRAITGYKE